MRNVGLEPGLQRCVLTSVQCPFLELCALFAAGARDSSLLEGQNLVLCMWQQALDMGHLSSAWQAHYFLHAAKNGGRRGCK